MNEADELDWRSSRGADSSSGPALRHRRRRLLPATAVLACAAVTVLLTRGLGSKCVSTIAPSAQDRSSISGAVAAGALADVLPSEGEWGTGWIRDDQAGWQQVADGPGLLHPCGARYPSDGQRTDLVRRDVKQDDMQVPVGSAMT